MCGQAGVHRRQRSRVNGLNDLVDALLREIESRGRDATGYLALMADGTTQIEKVCKPASRFVKTRKRIPTTARTVLLHTRFATVGRRDDPRNAHPVVSGTVAAVHNGTIYNADEIFEAFKLPRAAEVDSEVIPALINEAGWDNARDAIEIFQGGAAFAAVDSERPDEVLLARTVNYPMVYMVTDDLVVWASTERAIRLAWDAAFGRRPIGEFYHLAAWQMVRINGTVEVSVIKDYTPPPAYLARKAQRRPYQRSTGSRPYQRSVAKLPTTTGSKRARKKAKKRARSESFADDNPFTYGQGTCALSAYDQRIDDLMDAGLSWREAVDIADVEMGAIEDAMGATDYDEDDLPSGSRRAQSKSPATLAWEALGE